VRCFIAVPVPDPARLEAEGLLRILQARIRGARFVSTDVLHLTLHFFADVPSIQVDEVRNAAREGCSATAPFDVEPAGLGVFPDARHPKVLWIGVRDGRTGLEILHRAIARCLRERGLPVDDRPYRAHLTLARLGAPDPALPSVLATGASACLPAFPAREGILVQSVLHPSGSAHTILDRFPLDGR